MCIKGSIGTVQQAKFRRMMDVMRGNHYNGYQYYYDYYDKKENAASIYTRSLWILIDNTRIFQIFKTTRQ